VRLSRDKKRFRADHVEPQSGVVYRGPARRKAKEKRSVTIRFLFAGLGQASESARKLHHITQQRA
jgi:hypothetical protein